MPTPSNLAVAGLDSLPLHAMLSAAVVAFTLECGNEVERGFIDRGHSEMVSLVAWRTRFSR